MPTSSRSSKITPPAIPCSPIPFGPTSPKKKSPADAKLKERRPAPKSSSNSSIDRFKQGLQDLSQRLGIAFRVCFTSQSACNYIPIVPRLLPYSTRSCQVVFLQSV